GDAASPSAGAALSTATTAASTSTHIMLPPRVRYTFSCAVMSICRCPMRLERGKDAVALYSKSLSQALEDPPPLPPQNEGTFVRDADSRLAVAPSLKTVPSVCPHERRECR